jgi:hypothetical protein
MNMTHHPTKIIAINGAPRSGKDTAARIIRNFARKRALQPLLSLGLATTPSIVIQEINSMVRVCGMSYALKEITHAMYGVAAAHGAFEHCKDEPSPVFAGMSPRQAYIFVSEKLMKPTMGDDVFGRIFVRRNSVVAQSTTQERPGLIIVPDAGFAGEWGPVVDHYGPANMLLLRIHAEGRGVTFKGDSRSYIDLPDVLASDVHNDVAGEAGEELYAAEIERVVSRWLSTRAAFQMGDF